RVATARTVAGLFEIRDVIANHADGAAAAAASAGFEEIHPKVTGGRLLLPERDGGRRFGNVVLRDRVGHPERAEEIVEAVENVAARSVVGRIGSRTAAGEGRRHVTRTAENGQTLISL